MNWLYSLVFASLLFGSDAPTAVNNHHDAVAPVAATEIVVGDEVEKFEQSYPLSKNGNVSVSNVNGSITVEAWDRDEVKLEATKIADSKETLADVEIRVNSTADSFSVEADYKGWKWNNRGDSRNRKIEVEFRLSVPRTAILNEVETVNGSVAVSNFTNMTKISAVNGNVSATNLRGTAHLSTVNGEVTADFDRVDPTSKINLNTVNGTVSLVIPSDVNATIKADSLNGNITNDFGLPVRKGQYVGRDMYGRIGSGETQIKLNSVNGRLSVARKNDGRQVNPATNLLQNKKADEDDNDIDVEVDKNHAVNEARIQRDVARSLRDAQRATEQSMRDAQKQIEQIGPQLEKMQLDELKKLDKEKIKIDLDQKEMSKKIQADMDQRKAEWSRLSQSVWFGGAPTVEKKRNSFSVKGTPKVTVEASGCSVSIRGWDKDEVSYVVSEMASRRSEPAEVTDEHTNSSVSVRVVNNQPTPTPSFSQNPERVRIEVFVPRKSNLKVTTDGEIRLDGVSGEVELKGGDGAINIRDVDGSMSLVAETAQVRVIGFKGDFDSQTECGDVFLEGDFKKLSAKATEGTVTLTLPSTANATVTSNTLVQSDGFDLVQEKDQTWRVGKGGTKYNFTFDDGKLVVRSSEAVTSY